MIISVSVSCDFLPYSSKSHLGRYPFTAQLQDFPLSSGFISSHKIKNVLFYLICLLGSCKIGTLKALDWLSLP